MSLDPIDQPDYRRDIPRDPNPERIAKLERLTEDWRAAKAVADEARLELDEAMIAAWQTGHSFGHLRGATGLSVSAIQNMLKTRGLL